MTVSELEYKWRHDDTKFIAVFALIYYCFEQVYVNDHSFCVKVNIHSSRSSTVPVYSFFPELTQVDYHSLSLTTKVSNAEMIYYPKQE